MVNASVIFLLVTLLCFVLSGQLRKGRVNINIAISIGAALLAIFLGPQGFDLITAETVSSFEVLSSLGLGLVGFILGIKFRKVMGRFTQEIFSFFPKYALLFLVLTAGLMFLKNILPLELSEAENFQFPVELGDLSFMISSNYELLWVALILGLSGLTTSFVVDSTYLKKYNISESVRTRIFELKAISGYMAIILLGITLASHQGIHLASELGMSVLEWSAIAGASGVFCGVVFSIFLGSSKDEERIYLATIGAILFSCGLGQSLGISSLFVNFIFGTTLALTSGNSILIEASISRLLYPAYILLFFLAGLNFKMDIGGFIYLLPIYIAARCILMVMFIRNNNADKIVKENPFIKPIGKLFIAQDLLPIALGLSYLQTNQDWGGTVISILLPATIINLGIGYFFAKNFLIDVSEGTLSAADDDLLLKELS